MGSMSQNPPPPGGPAGGNGAQAAAGAAELDPRIGATFGKYTIIRLLGAGGMGKVYEGNDVGLKRSVAVKFLPDELLKKPDVIERFMREAQVAGRLNHPNIIAIYDVGMEERGAYMVMELLSPASASNRIKKKGAYPWVVATRIIADCCAALKVAHEAGIIHRDIKPDNILFSTNGVVKLVDFGLVKLVEDDLHLTQSGMLCGTPMYMSPEQASNKQMDPRSDLYSLGIAYFALLTGRAPFTAEGIPQILLAHLKDPIPDPRTIIPGIPEPVVQVLMHATEKDREARYQSAGDMAHDLEALLTGAPLRNGSIFAMEEAAMGAGPPPPPPSSLMRTSMGAGGAALAGASQMGLSGVRSLAANAVGQLDSPPPPSSRRGFLVAGGLGLAGLAAGGIYFLRRDGNGGRGDPGGPRPAIRPPPTKVSTEAIKVGILHSLSGALAVSERPLADASQLAIEELNGKGGVLGRFVQAVLLDGKSEVTADSAFTKGAQRLVETDKVAAVFGGYGSASRKLIVPFFEKANALLFYPAPYEGLEESASVIYTGSAPNQLAIPAIKWCAQALAARRFFFVGTDGLRPHAIAAIISDNVKDVGGEMVGQQFALVGELDFAAVVKKIEKSKASVILNMLVGDSTVAFFKALSDREISPRTLPVLSFALGENELAQMGSATPAGNYVARTRFPMQTGSGDDTFVARFKKKYGAHRPVSEVMEAAYYGVHLWAAAVEKVGTEDADKVRAALKEQEYAVAGARIRVDPSNQHTWKLFQVGKIVSDNSIEVVKTSDETFPPIPFPPPRTRGEWNSFSSKLYEQWGNNWANPAHPGEKKKRHSKKDE